MWIITGAVSVMFCLLAWYMSVKNERKAVWASACSLVFTAITELMAYRQVLYWVNRQDWAALSDVVPSMFRMLTGYVILMILGSIVPIFMNDKK